MRKVIVFNVVSLDGFHTGPSGDVTVMFPMMGDVFDTYNTGLLRSADLHLMGRASFELFQGFWPKVVADPMSDQWTDAQRDLARASAPVRGVVVSDSLQEDRPNLRIIRRGDAHREIGALKAQEGKDILITGSHTLWNDLLAHGLIDELHLMVGGRVLGEGIPVFTGGTGAALRLLDTRRWPGSDHVLLKYEVLNPRT